MKYALIAAGLLMFAPGVAAAQDDAPPAASINAHYTLDTPIKDLIADPAAKAVLDKDLPGMSSDENLPKFEDKSLRAMKPLSGGQLTDDLLKQVAADLAAISGEGGVADDAAPGDAATAAGDAATGASEPATDDTTADAAAPAGDPQAPVGR